MGRREERRSHDVDDSPLQSERLAQQHTTQPNGGGPQEQALDTPVAPTAWLWQHASPTARQRSRSRVDPHRKEPIGVLGAGSWGTALAIQLARSGRPVLLWGRDPAQLARLARERMNPRYLPARAFPDSLLPEPDFARLAAVRDLLVAVPSQGFRALVAALRDHGARPRLSWATKGLEEVSAKLPHEIAAEVLGPGVPLAALSGPTFAREVADGLPTAITVAANDPRFADDLAEALHGAAFRAYTSTDMVGVGVGGAVKNVIAIAAGMADGLGLGANSRAALVTRGLAEMMRLGRKLGARSETFMGLAGLGDLVLTCTDDQSRNRRLGQALARGQTAEAAMVAIGQAVEGVHTAPAVRILARRHGVEMPIVEQVDRVLHDGRKPRQAVAALLERARKRELD
jgi:glycerol-3-phosphate dehydrogenase (NAD(P)+)